MEMGHIFMEQKDCAGRAEMRKMLAIQKVNNFGENNFVGKFKKNVDKNVWERCSKIEIDYKLRSFCGCSVGGGGGEGLCWEEIITLSIKSRPPRPILFRNHSRRAILSPFWHITSVYLEKWGELKNDFQTFELNCRKRVSINRFNVGFVLNSQTKYIQNLIRAG